MSEKLKVLEPFEPRKLEKSFRELEQLHKQNKINFDIAIQRAKKWKDTKSTNNKSLLIFSMFLNMPMGEMHCNFKDGVYYFLDGQQRNTTVYSYINGEFCLKYVPAFYNPLDQTTYDDLNGKKFSELPVFLQEKITSYKPVIYSYDNLSDTKQAYIFKAANNGVALTKTEKARAEILHQPIIVSLAQHALMPVALTSKQIENRNDEQIVKEIWGIQNIPNVSFLDDYLTPAINDANITEDQQKAITAILDKLLECYQVLENRVNAQKDKKIKHDGKILLRKIFKKTHISTLTPVVMSAIENNIPDHRLADWIWYFFDVPKGKTSISEAYNKATGTGSSAATAVKTRIDQTMSSYTKYFKNTLTEAKNSPVDEDKLMDNDSTLEPQQKD